MDINSGHKAWVTVVIGLLIFFPGCSGKVDQDPWDQAREIMSEINLSPLPERIIGIHDRGATKLAIRHCAEGGGGRVLLPAGVYRKSDLRNVFNNKKPGIDVRKPGQFVYQNV